MTHLQRHFGSRKRAPQRAAASLAGTTGLPSWPRIREGRPNANIRRPPVLFIGAQSALSTLRRVVVYRISSRPDSALVAPASQCRMAAAGSSGSLPPGDSLRRGQCPVNRWPRSYGAAPEVSSSAATLYQRPVELLQQLPGFDTSTPPCKEAASIALHQPLDAVCRPATLW
jgi:hypothetical protein